jgi:hypothetical protein
MAWRGHLSSSRGEARLAMWPSMIAAGSACPVKDQAHLAGPRPRSSRVQPVKSQARLGAARVAATSRIGSKSDKVKDPRNSARGRYSCGQALVFENAALCTLQRVARAGPDDVRACRVSNMEKRSPQAAPVDKASMSGWGQAERRADSADQAGDAPGKRLDSRARIALAKFAGGQTARKKKPSRPAAAKTPAGSETAVELVQAAACEIQENCIQKNTEQLSVRFAKQENRRHRFKMLSAVGTGSNVHQFKTWSGDGLDLQSCTASEPGQASMCSAGG